MGISMTLIQEVGLYYRRHESNMTLDSVARNRCFIKALKKSLDRRRKEGQGSVSSLPKLTGIESAAGHTQEQPDSSSPRSE